MPGELSASLASFSAPPATRVRAGPARPGFAPAVPLPIDSAPAVV
jgi:hypothetical protein